MGSSPLSVREILAIVLGFADPKTLQAAAQVNSLWANEATKLLWRGQYRHEFPPLISLLQNIASSSEDRRYWYTSKIRHLELGCAESPETEKFIRDSLKSEFFKFPALRSVIVDLGSENMQEDQMVQLLSPNLISLELYGGYYASSFLDAIKKHSPGLKFLLLDNAIDEDNPEHPHIDLECLISFLDDMPSVVHLELERGYEHFMMEPFLRSLMRRPNLESLSLGHANEIRGNLTKEIISDTVKSGGDQIFPALRNLSIHAQWSAVASMIPFLGALQGIRLKLLDKIPPQKPGMLGLLSGCSRLEDVYLEPCCSGHIIASADFLALASGCAKMRRLEIEDGYVTDSGFNDQLIEKLTCRWKYLAVFSLPFEAELSEKSLVSLARNCPYLHELRIMSNFSLVEASQFSKPIEVLPCLEVFEMGSVDLNITSEAELLIILKSTMEYFDTWFPALQCISFDIVSGYPIGNNFMRLLRDNLSNARPPMLYPAAFPATSVSYELLQKLLEPDPSSSYNSAF